eukprot:Nk52_evm7s2650 gene=Nk52_evmTU7s2650
MSRGVSFIQMVWMMALCGVLLLATLQHANSMKVPVPQQEGGQVQEDAGEEIQGQGDIQVDDDVLTNIDATAGADDVVGAFEKLCMESNGNAQIITFEDKRYWTCSSSDPSFAINDDYKCGEFCRMFILLQFATYRETDSGVDCVCEQI